VRFNDLLATLNTLPARSIVLLHPCCHNPTGADLTLRSGIALLRS
jgi:aromatic-amino-acid transaminase